MIRKVELSDSARLVEIYNRYIEQTEITLETEQLTAEQFEERIACIIQKYPYYVYEENGKILGYVYLNVFNSRYAYSSTADLSIYLDMDYKGKGIGSLLYSFIEEEARKMGICKMISLITSSNIGSIAFHQKHGFKTLTNIERVAYKHNRWIDVTFMEKEIAHPDIPEFARK